MTLTGYAALFNVETTIAGLFREKIAPGAFRESLARDDIRALFNHDSNFVLGRMKAKTLTAREDAKGLRYTIEINADDPQAVSIAAKVKRGDVSGSSFGFAIDNPDDESWEPTRGLPLRTLKKLRLIDVSPVAWPAYEATSVTAWSEADGRRALELAQLRLRIANLWTPPPSVMTTKRTR